ncbi:MAG: radical SAM family heme chaperone HemW [Saprospiraceae bacterium]
MSGSNVIRFAFNIERKYNMSGIYLHIPFCKKACYYCNFHFSTSLAAKSEMVDAICKEIYLRKDYLNTMHLTSIYFGGGTPSLLSGEDFDKIFSSLAQYFTWDIITEITLEANPDDIQPTHLDIWKKMGVNRLSIGIQSFHDEDLIWMNRAHTAKEATQSIILSQDAGFNNLTIDLIYGSPTTSHGMWQHNLSKALEFDIPHISSYCLTVEEKTVLAHHIKKGLTTHPDPQKSNEQFATLVETLTNQNYDHYEISNFCKPGQYAIHNTNYWKGLPYLGLGPSAHSYDGSSRSWNVANNAKYMHSIGDDTLPIETEFLDTSTKYNEYIMTGLRTQWGVNKADILKFGDQYLVHFDQSVSLFLTNGMVSRSQNTYTLTAEGKYFADKIAMELFYVTDGDD